MWKHSVLHYYFLIFLRIISCCQCNLNNTDIDKRNVELENATTTDFTENTGTTTDPEEIFATSNLPQTSIFETNENTTESKENMKGLYKIQTNKNHITSEEHTNLDSYELNENSSEIVEAIVNSAENNFESYLGTTNPTFTTTENQSLDNLWKKCPHFKKGDTFIMEKMTDVWQVVYYRLPNNLKCFKLHIKAVDIKEQKHYLRVYGSFNDTVHWNDCFLEITSSEKDSSSRRHFLQGTQSDHGVMENVIIDEEYCKNTTYLTLHRETADQWLVIEDLLLMRDCETGDFVVFTRFPVQPRKVEIMDALKMFGENEPNGTMACNIEKTWLKYNEDVNLHDDHS